MECQPRAVFSAKSVVGACRCRISVRLSKNIIHWDTQFKAGNWYSREELTNDGLEGATLGIIGFGRIGPRLAKMATPFDMTILAYDPYVADEVADLLL